LAIIFLPREHSLLHGGPELFYHVGLWQLFQLLARGLVDVFFSRGFSHAGLIHFFLDASSVAWLDSCLGSFLCIHARCHESKGIKGQFGTPLAVSELSSYTEQF
jgi:hypothetical protein